MTFSPFTLHTILTLVISPLVLADLTDCSRFAQGLLKVETSHDSCSCVWVKHRSIWLPCQLGCQK
ncbi:hypothetical protein N9D66_02355, partial [Candidatus Nanopelagicales bacterium]|nr:hypothetical protein [Candidatus Nanopelagicales bacterium]